MDQLTIRIEDERATAALAARLADAARLGDTLLLEGTLGAGKTAFARHFARALGVPEEEPVTSPTFAIVHEYEARLPLLHADLYRLGSEDEVFELGLSEALGERVVALIEWGERFASVLAPVALLVRLSVPEGEGEEARVATLTARSERGRALLAAAGERA